MLAMLRTRLAVFWRRPLMKRAVLRAVQTNGAMIGQSSGVDLLTGGLSSGLFRQMGNDKAASCVDL